MRRKEFLSEDLDEFRHITNEAHTGYLGVIDKNVYPRIIPLNFVALGKDIYMHGAKEGEKYELVKENPKVTFSADLPYSFIPSYWTSKKSAVPASYFFKSLHIRGQGSMVEDIPEKAEALQAMMDKYQPEGGYTRLSPDERIYQGMLKEVGIFKAKTEELTLKIKFGQNMNLKQINQVISGLEERGLPQDHKTIELIRRYHPQLGG